MTSGALGETPGHQGDGLAGTDTAGPAVPAPGSRRARDRTTYRPAWYPNQDPDHNPWVVPDTMTGKTHYATWADSLKPGELLALIDEHAPDDR